MKVPDDTQELAQRIIALEEWVMHTDHLLENLNDVLCTVQDRLDHQSRTIADLKESIKRLTCGDEERQTSDDERPPHY